MKDAGKCRTKRERERERSAQNTMATDGLESLDDEETTVAETNAANQLCRRINPY